jgi:hypothetical protein
MMRFSTNKQKGKKRKRIKTVEKINSISTAEKKTTIYGPSCIHHASCMAWPPVPRPPSRCSCCCLEVMQEASIPAMESEASLSLCMEYGRTRYASKDGAAASLHCIAYASGRERKLSEMHACMGSRNEAGV